jgi:hypothetical protein
VLSGLRYVVFYIPRSFERRIFYGEFPRIVANSMNLPYNRLLFGACLSICCSQEPSIDVNDSQSPEGFEGFEGEVWIVSPLRRSILAGFGVIQGLRQSGMVETTNVADERMSHSGKRRKPFFSRAWR